jgi:alkylation response protein AidB-like acyl-CoA dehydrogenase
MDLALTETQQLLKNSVDDFLTRDASRDVIIEAASGERRYTDEMWRTPASLGWLGMAVPERFGGADASLTDIAVLFEALGAGPLPGPHFSSGVLAPLILREVATEEQQAEYLPNLASGDVVCAFAFTEPDWDWGPRAVNLRAQRTAEGYTLNGAKLFVYDADVADLLIVAVRSGDAPEAISLLMVPTDLPGVSARRLEGWNTSECAVRFDNVRVPSSALLGGADLEGNAWPALERALVKATPILCAYAVGGAQATYEMSVVYSRERRQFGQPIGRFQHVQNHIVQLINQVDAARWTTYEALWKLDAGRENADVSVHLAKLTTSEGYVQAANYAHEVHAGVGVMHEYGLTLYTRTARSLYHALGGPQWHRKRLGELLPQLAEPPEVA